MVEVVRVKVLALLWDFREVTHPLNSGLPLAFLTDLVKPGLFYKHLRDS